MSNLIHNERTKYAATFFNNIGVASFAVGFALPILNGATGAPAPWIIIGPAAVLSAFCCCVAVFLLGGLKE